MIRRLLYIIVLTLALSSCGAQKKIQISAEDTESVEQLLDEYLAVLIAEPHEVQKENIDYLITSSEADTALRNKVALRIYDYYSNSKVMGAESMAVYLTDKWFAPGTIPMRSSQELLSARVFAAFNRNSLIGMQAPEVLLQAEDYGTFTVPGDCSGRKTVLYFYDEGCSVCKLESTRLRQLTYDYTEKELDIVAIYTGQSEELWKAYAESSLPGNTANIRVINVWDPEIESDYPRLYGVTSTPKMFLLDEEGKIVGRNLDTPALRQLLESLDNTGMNVTPQEMAALVDILVADIPNPRCADITAIADNFNAQLEGTPENVRQSMLTALFYDLRYRDQYIFKCAADYMAEKYILPSPLTDPSTVADAELFRMLFAKAPLGEVGADFPLQDMKGTLWGIESEYTVVYIFSKSCERCHVETPVIDAIEKEFGPYGVTVARIDCDSYDAAAFIADNYDISVLPAIFLMGRDKTIYAKYLSAEALRHLLSEVVGKVTPASR